MDSTVEATPSIGPDGTIYAGGYAPSEEKHLYALDPETGEELWRFETGGGVYGTPAIDANGILYFGSYDQYFYSLNPDGTERWKLKTDGGVVASPTIDRDGTVYFGAWDNYLYAVDGQSGVELEEDYGDTLEENNNVQTPGFEIIILFSAIFLFLFLKKRGRKKV